MIYFVYPRLRKLSGAERLILRLATYLHRAHIPVTLVTHWFDISCRPALDEAVRVIATGQSLAPTRNHYLNAPLEYLYAPRLLRWIGRDARAIVFFGPPSLPALAWASLTRTHSLPLLYFGYEPPRFAYDDTPEVVARMGWSGGAARPLFALYKMLDRAMARRATVLLANSAFGAQRLRATYGREAMVITHGADLPLPTPEAIAAVRNRYRLADRHVLITVNFLHPRKRIDLLLRALARLRAESENVVALIVGAGPEEAALQQLARNLGLGEIALFTGFVPDEQLSAYYAASDLYMHTARLESFGLSVLEASAAGLPVVAVKEGGPCEIVADGETGLLVEADVRALADAARALLREPTRRAAMGRAARQRAHTLYSWERGAQDLIRVLENLS